MDLTVKGFNELHISIRGLLISLILIMPFWYLDLYLFKKDFFYTYFQQIPIIISFCLSIIWILLSHLSYLFCDSVFFVQEEDNEIPIENPRIVSMSVCFMVIHLGLLSSISYVYKWNFLFFLKVSFATLIIRVFLWLTAYLSKSDAKK
jgi:hypothetical protein